MADEIIEELWAVKEAISKEVDYDIDKLVDRLHQRHPQGRHTAVDLSEPRGQNPVQA